MALARPSRLTPDVDMGPLCDVAFQLIIFFIVTTTLVKPAGRLLDIPSAARQEQPTPQKNLTVNILPDQLRFGQDEQSLQTLGFDQFRQALADLNLPQQTESQRMIVVNLAENVPYDAFYKVVTAISQAGGIVTLVEEEEPDSSTQEAGP